MMRFVSVVLNNLEKKLLITVQCSRVIKSVMFVIEMISVKNLLASFCCVLGKTLYDTFPCLVVLASSSKY